ncbi:MAG: hypothetical protein NC217_03100 [Muribaculaceae bacterium]|nr:hypothetical protein [Muribaculaceae bacterium]
MKTIYISILAAGFGLMAPALMEAQELSGSLSATGDYKAEIRPHNRLSGLPQRLTTIVPEGALPLAFDGVAIYNEPSLVSQTAGVAGPTLPQSYRGYLGLQAGSYLSNSLNAGYRFVDTDKTTFGAWLQHSCTTPLYRAETSAISQDGYKSKIYKETIGLYGSHIFDGVGRLDAAVAYRLGYFNYYTSALWHTDTNQPLPAPSQTLNDFKMSALWHGNTFDNGLFINGEFSYRYFGYRRFYSPMMYLSLKPTRENDLKVGVTLGYDLNEANTLSLTARSQSLFYCNPHTVSDVVPNLPYQAFFPGYQELRSCGIVSLKPRYTLSTGDLSLRLGATVDLSWDIVGPYQRNQPYYPGIPQDFSTVHIAPDVALDYASGKTNLYLKVGGGVTPNTLASRSEYFMYQSPALLNTMPQYSPIDATVGVKFGSFSGLTAGIHASYAIADNTPTMGWYPDFLADKTLMPNYEYNVLDILSLKGYSLGADLEYKLASLLEISGAVTYQHQNGKDGYFNGIDRPRWTINAGADVTPITGLTFGVSYEYRGVRNLYLGDNVLPLHAPSPAHNFSDGTEYTHNYGYVVRRLKDVYNLGAHASYTFLDRYTLSMSVDNILNCEDDINFLIPTPGMTVMGGFQVLF